MLIFFIIAVTGFEYLLVDPIAQRVGMGYGLGADGYSVHYNPAGLSYSTSTETYYSTAYLNYIGGTHFGFLGFERSQIGLGIKYFYSGSMKKTDALGNEYGTFSTNFIDLNLGKGFFLKDIGLGASIKLVYENIDTLFSLGAGFDIGGLYILTPKNIQIGLAIKNIGSSMKPFIQSNETFPYEINLGFVKRFNEGWLGLDLVKPALVSFGVRLGGEYALNSMFSVKASYNSMLSSMRTGDNGLDILTGLVIGFAIKKSPILINYAYAPYFELGAGHRISISLGG